MFANILYLTLCY